MVALLEKVDHELIVLDGLYAAYAPGSMKHVVAFVKTDVFLEVGDRFMDIAPRLAQIGNLYVIVQMAVPGVPIGVHIDQFSTRAVVLRIVVENTFQYVNRRPPILFLPIVRVQGLQQTYRAIASECARNSRFDLHQSFQILRLQLNNLCPNLLDWRQLPAVDITMQRLLVIRQSTIQIAFFFTLFGQRTDRIGILQVDLDEALPDLVLLFLVGRLAVRVCQRAQRKLVFSVAQYRATQVLHNVPLGAVYEHVRQHNQVGVVDDPLAQCKGTGQVQRDDAIPANLQMFLAEFLHFVQGFLRLRCAQQLVEFVKIGNGVAGQRGARPFLFVEHFADSIDERFCHLLFLRVPIWNVR